MSIKLSLFRFLILAISVGFFATASLAQETKTESKPAASAAKKVPQPKGPMMVLLREAVTDLTDEQNAKIKEAQQEAGAKHKQIIQSVGLDFKKSQKAN